MQAAMDVAPGTFERVPGSHRVHPAAPAAAHVPAGHEAQVLGPVAPVLSENDPGGQGVQLWLPLPANVPGPQRVQLVEPANPALQVTAQTFAALQLLTPFCTAPHSAASQQLVGASTMHFWPHFR
jgi:hypothetical protein